MANFDYWQTLQDLRDILALDQTLQGCSIQVEKELEMLDNMPFIGIYLERREADPTAQYLANGSHQQYNLDIVIWLFVFGLELDVAMKTRNDILGKIEVCLMKNRTINGKVRTLMLQGGEMPSAKLQDVPGVIVGAETRIRADVTFTT